MSAPPFLLGIRTVASRLPLERTFPFSLSFVPTLALEFTSAVTFLVGENGSGKSTLLEGLAALCRLPVSGGSRGEAGLDYGPESDSSLSYVLRPSFHRRPVDGFFLRAEFAAHFATLLDSRKEDPEFAGNPYARYGGRSLHMQSHGEAFLAVLKNRFTEGIFLLDEPEAALSPQRQLALLALMYDLTSAGHSQFIVATHSPILMTYPDAQLVSFDHGGLPTIPLQETSHYQITRGILSEPARYWKHLRNKAQTGDDE